MYLALPCSKSSLILPVKELKKTPISPSFTSSHSSSKPVNRSFGNLLNISGWGGVIITHILWE